MVLALDMDDGSDQDKATSHQDACAVVVDEDNQNHPSPSSSSSSPPSGERDVVGTHDVTEHGVGRASISSERDLDNIAEAEESKLEVHQQINSIGLEENGEQQHHKAQDKAELDIHEDKENAEQKDSAERASIDLNHSHDQHDDAASRSPSSQNGSVHFEEVEADQSPVHASSHVSSERVGESIKGQGEEEDIEDIGGFTFIATTHDEPVPILIPKITPQLKHKQAPTEP